MVIQGNNILDFQVEHRNKIIREEDVPSISSIINDILGSGFTETPIIRCKTKPLNHHPLLSIEPFGDRTHTLEFKLKMLNFDYFGFIDQYLFMSGFNENYVVSLYSVFESNKDNNISESGWKFEALQYLKSRIKNIIKLCSSKIEHRSFLHPKTSQHLLIFYFGSNYFRVA